jgi:hypothetical protein
LLLADGLAAPDADDPDTEVAGAPEACARQVAGPGAGIVRLRYHGRSADPAEDDGVSVAKPFAPVDLWRAMARVAP